MHIGIQLLAPQGLGSLAADCTYYLFCNRPDVSAMTFAWFAKSKDAWRVYLIRLTRTDVEVALREGRLQIAPEQTSMPPWLADFEGVSFDALEEDRRRAVLTFRQRATARLQVITPFLTDEFDRAFDGARHPEKFFRRRLKELWPRKNEKRSKEVVAAGDTMMEVVGNRPNDLRALLWYCTYRLFGRELEALMPAYTGIGVWLRTEETAGGKRLGRPNKHSGLLEGHSAIGIAPRIQDSYARFCGLGKTMAAIHIRALREEFGCLVETLPDGRKRFYQPENLRFPSYQQYRRWTIKEYGLEAVQKARLGEVRHRSHHAARVGAFSQECANYLESSEADVYQIPERPRQLLSDEPGPPLLVCRLVDTVSANIFGVGFSLASEKAEAYALAKFCAVVPRKLMGRIFGIPLDDSTWPGRGISSRAIVDRGVGSSPLAEGPGGATSPAREIAPSWSGQSKGTVESSHPRNTVLEGEPTYTISHLNVFQMAVRELLRTPAENERTDATDRLTPDMLAAGVAGNPTAITRYLLGNLRTSAISMSTESAVRKFLRPVEFKLKPDGLWLDVLLFSHTHLLEHGLPARVPAEQLTLIKGYVYPFSLYLAWVEIGGRLYEVEPQLRIRDDLEQLRITLADLQQLGDVLLATKARQREHGTAAMAEAEALFYKLFGVRWDAADRKRGRVPRSAETEGVPTAAAIPRKSAA